MFSVRILDEYNKYLYSYTFQHLEKGRFPIELNAK